MKHVSLWNYGWHGLQTQTQTQKINLGENIQCSTVSWLLLSLHQKPLPYDLSSFECDQGAVRRKEGWFLGSVCVCVKIINTKPRVIVVHLASITMLWELLRNLIRVHYPGKAVNETVGEEYWALCKSSYVKDYRNKVSVYHNGLFTGHDMGWFLNAAFVTLCQISTT